MQINRTAGGSDSIEKQSLARIGKETISREAG
jgi:hypothetical protein